MSKNEQNNTGLGKAPYRYYTQATSIKGRREYQEDRYLISHKPNSCLVLVADGLGGHGHGDFASQLCTHVYREAFNKAQSISDPAAFLRNTALQVNRQLLQKGEEDPDFTHCGTTLTGILVQGSICYLINIGDSRIYAFDGNGTLSRLTKDHSVVQNLLDQGQITEQEAFFHPRRNIVTSALGLPFDHLQVSVDGPLTLQPAQVLLAFSDGVHDALQDHQLLKIIQCVTSELTQTLVVEAYRAGGKDNMTACLLSLHEKYLE